MGDMVLGHADGKQGVEYREEALLHPIDDDSLSDESDELLVLRFQQTGDPRFFERLVARHRGSIRAICLRIFGDGALADDVTQDVFAKAWQEMPRFEAWNFRAWIHTIARHRCVNELKRGFRQYEIAEPEECSMSVPDREPDEQKRLEIEACLAKLTSPQRIVLKLYYFEGLTYDEIVNRTGYSAKAVKSHIQNGRRMLRKLWGEGADGQ